MAKPPAVGVVTPVLAIVNGIPTATSTYIARCFGKRHGVVMRDIRGLIALDPECLCNFVEASHQVHEPNGGMVEYPEYRITEEGFMLLAMGFTGYKALVRKRAFLAEFRRMRAEVTQALPAPAVPKIDVAHLLLAGQSAPVPLTPEQYRQINRRADAMSAEARSLIREHLLRAVAHHVLPHELAGAGGGRAVHSLLESITLGQALAHEHYQQLDYVRTLIDQAGLAIRSASDWINADIEVFKAASRGGDAA